MDTTIWTIRDFLYDEVICPQTSSINDYYDANSINIYPNPSAGKITINFSEQIINANIVVYDIQGSVIFSSPINNGVVIIENNLFIKGIYFLAIKQTDNYKPIAHKKIIIN